MGFLDILRKFGILRSGTASYKGDVKDSNFVIDSEFHGAKKKKADKESCDDCKCNDDGKCECTDQHDHEKHDCEDDCKCDDNGGCGCK